MVNNGPALAAVYDVGALVAALGGAAAVTANSLVPQEDAIFNRECRSTFNVQGAAASSADRELTGSKDAAVPADRLVADESTADGRDAGPLTSTKDRAPFGVSLCGSFAWLM